MAEGTPDPVPESAPPGPAVDLVPIGVFHALNDAVEAARRARHLGDVLQAETMLALWDAVVLDETARGLAVSEGGKAERAFGGHLAGLLRVSRPRAVTMLHTSLTLRALPATFAVFRTGAFGWQAVEAVVRHLGALAGDAREQYDLQAARFAAEAVPQRLDVLLSRLHDSLDHDDATDAAATAHRCRGVRARPGVLPGSAVLSVTGPETDIAAVYETARKAAVAAHGVEGESRSLQQLMYDCTLDVLLHGFNTAPASVSTSDDDSGAGDGDDSAADVSGAAGGRETPSAGDSGAEGGREAAPTGESGADHAPTDGSRPRTPATPHERLGDPRVPQRKAIQATILVTVPASTAAGVSNEPGRLAGWGSLPAAEVRRIVAAGRYWTRVETDPVDDAILAFDSKERAIPTALRRLIWMRSETCDEPGCPVSAHLADIDHVIRFEHGGRTTEINLSALCRGSHQTKDDGYVDVTRTPAGDLHWNTPRWGGSSTKRAAMKIRRTAPSDGQPTAAGHPAADDTWDPAPWDTAA